MKSGKISYGAVAIILIAATMITSQAQSPTPGNSSIASATISDLAWLAGSWQTKPGGRAQIEEHWTMPAGGSLLGMSRTIAGNKTAEFEFLRIEQRGDAIFYVASPRGRCPATDFKLTRLSAGEAMFENPQHDFPKRIIYRKSSDGSMTASIDAGEGTKAHSFAYVPMGK